MACAARRTVVTAPSARQETLASLKQVETDLGYDRTGNFAGYSDHLEAYYYCYFTGEFELPDSYQELLYREGSRDGCDLDESRFDVFFYPMEAKAGAETPVSDSLEKASDARFAMVVAHEDFHDAAAIQLLPTRFREAAATLVGFLTAAEHARRSRPEATALSDEAGLYLLKATLQNRYHEELSQLYASLDRTQIDEATARARKHPLYTQLTAECEAISPIPATFNPCPAVLNNAGLAFDLTYTRYYPLLYDLHLALGEDPAATIDALKSVPPSARASESATEAWFRSLLSEHIDD